MNSKTTKSTRSKSFTTKSTSLQKSQKPEGTFKKAVVSTEEKKTELDSKVPTPNVDFYTNNFKPFGVTIDEFLAEWKGKYDLLEDHHNFIQWIFPNSTRSRFNPDAEVLTPKEANAFIEDKEIAKRLVEAYELMLDFYGMRLDKKTGKIFRAENWNDRYLLALIQSPHNHLRITRIMHCLLETGFARYSQKLSEFLLAEIAGNADYKTIKSGTKGFEELDPFQEVTLDSYKPLDCLATNPCKKFWAMFSTETSSVESSKTKAVSRLKDLENSVQKTKQKESIYFKLNGY